MTLPVLLSIQVPFLHLGWLQLAPYQVHTQTWSQRHLYWSVSIHLVMHTTGPKYVESIHVNRICFAKV